MIDLEYYLKLAPLNPIQKSLIQKYFGSINFDNLGDCIYFFQRANEKTRFITHQKDKRAIKNIAPVLITTLKDNRFNYFVFLDNHIYPYLDIDEVLNDLNPQEAKGAILLECPFCRNSSKNKATKNNRDAFIVKTGNNKTGIIKCSRTTHCGKTINIIKYIQQRDALNFKEVVVMLCQTLNKNLEDYESREEQHKSSIKKPIQKKKLPIKSPKKKLKNPEKLLTIKPIYKSANLKKVFNTKVDYKSLENSYKELPKKYRLQLIYRHIQLFTLKEQDERALTQYFISRGLKQEQIKGVGYLKKSKIEQLTRELIAKYTQEDLIEFGILHPKYKSWMHLVRDKNLKAKRCDSAVFFMHDIYTNMITNIEFKFFGEDAKDAKVNAGDMSCASLLYSQYYGKNTIDFIKDESEPFLWWTEAVVDSKSLELLNLNTVSLLGVKKHRDKNIGYYKNKISIIAFDEDTTGVLNTEIFARKLREAGAKHIFIASWDSKHGKDINELLLGRALHHIKISYSVFTHSNNAQEIISYDITKLQSINKSLIENAYSA